MSIDEPISCCGFAGFTFRQLDVRGGLAKGSAFRAFKRGRGGLREGTDYLWLEGEAHAALREQLLEQGLVYPGTVNVTLIAPPACARLGL